MIVAVFFLIALAVLLYMGSSFIKEKYWPALERSPLTELSSAKKEGLWAISDVDNEYEIGKLTQEDHEYLRRRLKAELMEILDRERKLMQDISIPSNADIAPALKQKLIREVLRNSGIQQSYIQQS
jgi:hypothetical protein